MNREQVLNPRTAGGVVRYHAWPTLQRQTVADHSFHVMRIYCAVFGRLPELVAETILWHDMAEVKTGDIPFPLKAEHPEVKAALAPIENAAIIALGGRFIDLDEWVLRRIKACDLLEMLEFGLVEMTMGNKFAEPIVHDIRVVLSNMDMNESDFKLVNMYCETIMEAYDVRPSVSSVLPFVQRHK